jgi:hypothetical protein
VYSIFYHCTTPCTAVVTHLAIQPHALNTPFVLYLTKCYSTTQIMLTPYRCTPSQVANNLLLGEQPFPCEEIYYKREKAIHPSVYQVLFVLRIDILKNISHYSLTTLETAQQRSVHLCHQWVSMCLGQCTTSKCLLPAPHLQCLLKISKTSACHYSGNITCILYISVNRCLYNS